MNSGFYSHTTTHEIRRCAINCMRKYNKKHANGLDGALGRNINDRDNEMGKNRYHKEKPIQNASENERKKTYNSISKPSKLYTQQKIMEKIDRILLKNAFSHTQTPNLYSNMNTSIQQGTLFTHYYKNIQIQDSNTPQNEQANIKNGLKQENVRPKVQISKIRTNLVENRTIRLIDSYRNRQSPKLSLEQHKKKSTVVTPSQNQWQNFMNLIKSNKKQSEYSKKYCRIMIRRINTDQLFTKRVQSHKKTPSYKEHHLNRIKRMKPIRNIMSEVTPLKRLIDMPLYEKSMNFDIEDIKLNPWSTNEIKWKEQNEKLHHI